MKHKALGLTLVELMVVIAVLGIAASMAFPSLSRLMQGQAVGSQAELLAGDLRQARTEALRRGVAVRLCIRKDDTNECDANTASWKNGWLMFADINGDGALAEGEILKVQQALQPASLRSGATVTGSTATAVEFSPTGISNGFFAFSLTTAASEDTRYVCLNRAGRVKVGKVEC